MTVTAGLRRLHLVDGQLRGLQSRLAAAERFVAEQERLLAQVDAAIAATTGQLRQVEASILERESESARLEARMARLREQMNAARTNKEYKSFLTELNTFKAERERVDDEAMEQMGKAEQLREQLARLGTDRAEREKLLAVARDQRGRSVEETRQRVSELRADRSRLAAQVPGDAVRQYEQLVDRLGDEAMAPVQEQDRKRHEYTCGSCHMTVPIETVNALIKGQAIKTCASCRCILYIEEELAGAVQAGSRR
jgi:predicted  nucleic acid-binding Zn-ribbon protein